MTHEVNSPEFFGLHPGDEGYDTFADDFPVGENGVADYRTSDFEMGHDVGTMVLRDIVHQHWSIANVHFGYADMDTSQYEFNNGTGFQVPPLRPETKQEFDKIRREIDQQSQEIHARRKGPGFRFVQERPTQHEALLLKANRLLERIQALDDPEERSPELTEIIKKELKQRGVDYLEKLYGCDVAQLSDEDREVLTATKNALRTRGVYLKPDYLMTVKANQKPGKPVGKEHEPVSDDLAWELIYQD
ncbi:MAG: hypothetical protein U5L95_01030 [Candidatus Saccharibacteria bacterium]|nr:hypothetical protein [Candidatus Saccharibacteria bacterium]